MYIQLSPEAIQTLKSLDRIPDSAAETSRPIADELLKLGLAYESRICGIINSKRSIIAVPLSSGQAR